MKVNFKKEVKEWGILVIVLLALYFTGFHTQVAALAQRAFLSTGLFSPIAKPQDEEVILDYNFTLKKLSGEEVHFSEFKDKVVFINIWATWCAPCIAEMPGIQNMYDNLKSEEDMAFVMLGMDKDQSKPEAFIEKKGYGFPVYLPMQGLPDLFRVPSIPTTLIFNKQGKLISKKVGMAGYHKKSFIKFMKKNAGK